MKRTFLSGWILLYCHLKLNDFLKIIHDGSMEVYSTWSELNCNTTTFTKRIDNKSVQYPQRNALVVNTAHYACVVSLRQ